MLKHIARGPRAWFWVDRRQNDLVHGLVGSTENLFSFMALEDPS